MSAANAPAERHHLTFGEDIVEDHLQVGEGRAVCGDELLQVLGARWQSGRTRVLDVVSSHTIVHGGYVAFDPRLLKEFAYENFVPLFSRHRTSISLAGCQLAFSP